MLAYAKLHVDKLVDNLVGDLHKHASSASASTRSGGEDLAAMAAGLSGEVSSESGPSGETEMGDGAAVHSRFGMHLEKVVAHTGRLHKRRLEDVQVELRTKDVDQLRRLAVFDAI